MGNWHTQLKSSLLFYRAKVVGKGLTNLKDYDCEHGTSGIGKSYVEMERGYD
jgi:hypothetical protein